MPLGTNHPTAPLLTWGVRACAAEGTYRIGVVKSTENLSSRGWRSRMGQIHVGELLSSDAMPADAGSVSMSPPPMPTLVHHAADTTVRHLSQEEIDLRNDLRLYAHLPDNWDDEGAASPSQQAVEDVLLFLDRLPDGIPLPFPEVAADGDVGVYWEDGGIFAVTAFEGNGTYAYYAERKDDGRVVEEYGQDGLDVTKDWPADMVGLLHRLDPGRSPR